MRKATELRALRGRTLDYVKKQFEDDAGEEGARWEVESAEQVVMSEALADAFERERTRLTTVKGVARPLTKQLWMAPTDDRYEPLLEHGFFGGYTGSAHSVTFWESPVAALEAGKLAQPDKGRAPRHVLQCRVTLGREGQDYTVTHAGQQKHTAYVLRTPLAVPAFTLLVGLRGSAPPTPVKVVEYNVTHATAMTICPQCFETCVAGAAFCSACGAKLDGAK